jgi:hypothetical protein
MSLMGKCCCGGGCNGACLAVTPGTNDCTASIPPTAYQNSLPTYVTVEIDLTWDGTPYSFSIVMKKYSTLGYGLCQYKMYCGDVDSCDAWPHTIAGDVLMGKNGTCTQTYCTPCNDDQYNPTNLPSPYLMLITCEVNNNNAIEDSFCPCNYPDAGCSWNGTFNIQMHASYLCTDYYFNSPATASKNLLNVEPDVCTPVYLLDSSYPSQHCSAKIETIADPYTVFDSTLASDSGGGTCQSPLIGIYPLTRDPAFGGKYTETFDRYGAGSVFYGYLSTDTYQPCCGSFTPTGGHAITWTITRFEVV